MDAAQAEEFKALTPELARAARQHMLRKLLQERFMLTMHRETKELPVYNLVIAKGGSKLQESKPDDNAGSPAKPLDAAAAAKIAGAKPAGSPGGPTTCRWGQITEAVVAKECNVVGRRR